MAASTTSDPRWRPPRRQLQDGGPTTSDPRWRPPRHEIQDGGPTKSDPRWRSLWRVRLHLGGWVNALDHEKVASRPRARCRSSLYTKGIYGLSCIERTRIWKILYWGFFFLNIHRIPYRNCPVVVFLCTPFDSFSLLLYYTVFFFPYHDIFYEDW